MSATEIYNEVLPTLDITCPDHDVNNPDYEANKALPPITTGPGAAVLAPPFLAPLAEVVPCPAAACAAPLAAPLASPKALLSPPACMAAEAAVEKEVPAVEEVAVAEVQGAKPIMSRVSLSSRHASIQPLFAKGSDRLLLNMVHPYTVPPPLQHCSKLGFSAAVCSAGCCCSVAGPTPCVTQTHAADQS